MRLGAELEDEEIGNEKLIEENFKVVRYEKKTLPCIDNYNDGRFCIANVGQGCGYASHY
jgi:hypothetical protein